MWKFQFFNFQQLQNQWLEQKGYVCERKSAYAQVKKFFFKQKVE